MIDQSSKGARSPSNRGATIPQQSNGHGMQVVSLGASTESFQHNPTYETPESKVAHHGRSSKNTEQDMSKSVDFSLDESFGDVKSGLLGQDGMLMSEEKDINGQQ